MNKIAITGSSGFIGKHLVKYLLDKKEEIIKIDIDEGYDLLSNDDIDQIPKFDVIIHLAAKSFVPLSFEKPWDYYFHNYNLTLNVLELARKNKAKVIFLSSYLYGSPNYLPIDEKHPLAPHNPYAQSKLICEKLCEGYSRDFNVPIVVFRPFNIYGPGQNSSFIIPSILQQINRGIITLNDPRPKRDFIYIDDVCNAINLAISHTTTQIEIFNIGFGKSYSIKELIEIILDISKKKAETNFTNEFRKGEIYDTVSDNTKFERVFNWRPLNDLNTGLKKYLATVMFK